VLKHCATQDLRHANVNSKGGAAALNKQQSFVQHLGHPRALLGGAAL